MEHITVIIEGTTPLILNRFTEEAQRNATSGNRASTVGEQPAPRTDAESRLYVHENVIGVPQPNLMSCLTEGGKFFKAGRTKVTTQRSSLVPAAVMIEPIFLPITHKHPWEVDSRPIRNPVTGGRVIRHRPMFNDWLLKFELTVDTDILALNLVREIVDAAGKRIGLGDFRPACKGPFGRFVVVKWSSNGGRKK